MQFRCASASDNPLAFPANTRTCGDHDSGVVDPLFDMSNLLVTLCPLAMSERVSDCRAADGHAPRKHAVSASANRLC